jgi:hypothetical protein
MQAGRKRLRSLDHHLRLLELHAYVEDRTEGDRLLHQVFDEVVFFVNLNVGWGSKTRPTTKHGTSKYIADRFRVVAHFDGKITHFGRNDFPPIGNSQTHPNVLGRCCEEVLAVINHRAACVTHMKCNN